MGRRIIAVAAAAFLAVLACACSGTARTSLGTFRIDGGTGNPCSPIAAPSSASPTPVAVPVPTPRPPSAEVTGATWPPPVGE